MVLDVAQPLPNNDDSSKTIPRKDKVVINT